MLVKNDFLLKAKKIHVEVSRTVGFFTAVEDVAAHKVLAVDLRLADKDTNPTVLGITMNAAVAGSTVKVLLSGWLQDSSFNFVQGSKLWLGNDGELLQEMPTAGTAVFLGWAISQKELLLRVGQKIILA